MHSKQKEFVLSLSDFVHKGIFASKLAYSLLMIMYMMSSLFRWSNKSKWQ
jgi:hypothetical protein